MQKKDLKNKILNTIESKNILPKPKWQFLFRNYSLWFFGTVFIFVGGVATSLVIFIFVNSEWESYHYLSRNLFEHLTKTAPYFWLASLIVFIILANYNFFHTKKGYKHSVAKITGLIILMSIILGSIFYQIGLAHITDYELGRKISIYEGLIEKRQKMWNHPEEGLMSGRVISYNKDKNILVVKDCNGKEWNIRMKRLGDIDFIILNSVKEIKLVGYKEGETSFDACAVRPWKIKGESVYLKEKVLPYAKESEEKDFSRFRQKENLNNLSERNFFRIRNNLCERGTTSPLGPNY